MPVTTLAGSSPTYRRRMPRALAIFRKMAASSPAWLWITAASSR